MRIAAICSAGGAPIITCARLCPEVEFFVITDRACGAEAACVEAGIKQVRIEEADALQFSDRVLELLQKEGPFDATVLLFSRLVKGPLLLKAPLLCNLHPSLLPAFPGIRSTSRTREHGCRWLGATLHVVTEKMDDGHILVQACTPADPCWPIEKWHKISYLQKTGLLLCLLQQISNTGACFEPQLEVDATIVPGFSPPLNQSPYTSRMRQLLKEEGVCLS
jgi:phosphoribosylglycinamide formyltransferase-1